MLKKSFVLLPLFACFFLLVMGALDQQPPLLPSAAAASFVAHPIPLDANLETLTPEQLLARAAAALAPERTPWLRVKTWQKQLAQEVSFEAEGSLLLGPDHCARLEMSVQTGQQATTILTVSDGVGFARASRRAAQPPQITTQKFTTAAGKPMTSQEIDDILNVHGCGGPYCLLRDLERRVHNLQAARGTWKDRPVIRLTAAVKGNVPPESRFADPPRTCELFLDAQTLWPHRVEWWTAPGPEGRVLFLQLEFRDAQVNQPLSHEDCVREFTYLPE